jgi:hypothetical protein
MVESPEWEKDFPFPLNIQTGLEACSALYSVGARNVSPLVRQLFHEADHSPPSNAEVKTEWICTSTLIYFHGVHRGNFDFYLLGEGKVFTVFH